MCKFNIRNSVTNKLIENDTNRQSPKRIRNNLYSSNDLSENETNQRYPKRSHVNSQTLNSPTTEIRSSINSMNLQNSVTRNKTKKCGLCDKTNHTTNRSVYCTYYIGNSVTIKFFCYYRLFNFESKN